MGLVGRCYDRNARCLRLARKKRTSKNVKNADCKNRLTVVNMKITKNSKKNSKKTRRWENNFKIKERKKEAFKGTYLPRRLQKLIFFQRMSLTIVHQLRSKMKKKKKTWNLKVAPCSTSVSLVRRTGSVSMFRNILINQSMLELLWPIFCNSSSSFLFVFSISSDLQRSFPC